MLFDIGDYDKAGFGAKTEVGVENIGSGGEFDDEPFSLLAKFDKGMNYFEDLSSDRAGNLDSLNTTSRLLTIFSVARSYNRKSNWSSP